MKSYIPYLTLALIGIALILLSLQRNEFDQSEWYSFQEASSLSLKEGKEIFLFISSPTCPKCNYFKSDVFSREEVMSAIKTRFIPAYVDITKESPPLNVFLVPTFCTGYPDNLSCFQASNGDELLRILEQR